MTGRLIAAPALLAVLLAGPAAHASVVGGQPNDQRICATGGEYRQLNRGVHWPAARAIMDGPGQREHWGRDGQTKIQGYRLCGVPRDRGRMLIYYRHGMVLAAIWLHSMKGHVDPRN